MANHLVLARLLSPEVFGLMAIVNSCIMGLQLFSDLGIRQKIIQSPRGADPTFVNTAWTLQVFRGVILWLATLILALPLAHFYDAEVLIYLVPVVGLTAILEGFRSTRMITLERQLAPGRVSALQLGCQIIAIAVMILLAWATASVWALVGGALVASAASLIGSHTLLPGDRNRFQWARDCARELIHFGRWMLPATVIYFILQYGQRLIVGKFVTLTELGLFSIALFVGNFVAQLVGVVSARVLLPLYALLGRAAGKNLNRRLMRARSYLLALMLPIICVVAVWGPELVSLLYDARYLGAGWMIQVLALGSLLGTINATSAPLLLVHGDSRRHFLSLALALCFFVCFVVLGFLLWGWRGIVVAVAAIPFAYYPGLAWALSKHGAWQPRVDLSAALGSAALVGLLQVIKLELG